MKVMIIGAKGQLGSDIHELLKNTDYNDLGSSFNIVTIDHDTWDIKFSGVAEAIISKHKPDVVINCAAYHNCNLCEDHPNEAFAVNATALYYLSIACNAYDAQLIHISTDYVYGIEGTRDTPYTEYDIPGPVQMYGITKLAGENIVRQYCKRHIILRTSGLYGNKGAATKKYPNFVEMMITLGKEAIEKDAYLPCTTDQYLTFTSTKELARVIHEMITMEFLISVGTFHATCEGYINRFDFAMEIFKHERMDVKLTRVTSEYFDSKYEQPKFSVLENYRLKMIGIDMLKWKDALHEYLDNRAQT